MGAFAEVEEQKDADPVPRAKKLECDKVRFNTDSCIPDPKALDVFRSVLQICVGDPDLALLIISHTDLQSNAKHNQWLSESRSTSIVLLLTNHPREWAKHVVQHRTEQSGAALQKDVDDVLAYYAMILGWSDVAPPKGKAEKVACGPQVKRFKERCDARFTNIEFTKVSEEPDEDFWLCVALSFHHGIKDQLSLSSMGELVKQYFSKVQWLDPDHPGIGCGQRLLRDKDSKTKDVRENRRTEFLFFPSKDRPTKKDDPPKHPADQPPAWLEALGVPAVTDSFNALKCPDPPLARHGNILFVLDCSNSMTIAIAGAQTRMELARAQLAACIWGLDGRDHFGIVAYSSDMPNTQRDRSKLTMKEVRVWEPRPVAARPGTPVTPTAGLVPELFPATEETKVAAIKYIFGPDTTPSGVTMTARALQVAFKAVGLRAPDAGEKSVPMTVVLLTDGQPTGSDTRAPGDTAGEQKYILDNVEKWNAKQWPLAIYGILAATGSDGLHKFLQDLAKKKPGVPTNSYIPWGPGMKTVGAKTPDPPKK